MLHYRRELYSMSGFCKAGIYLCMYDADDASFVGGLLRNAGFDAVVIDCVNDFCEHKRASRLETNAGYDAIMGALLSLAALNKTLKSIGASTCADVTY